MKRNLSPDQLRKPVRARLTKGDAFRVHEIDTYQAKQKRVETELEAMTREEIFIKFPHLLYDVKP